MIEENKITKKRGRKMSTTKISETSQVFNIECAGVQITEVLLKVLLRQYFDTIKCSIEQITVIEIKKDN